MDYLLGLRLLSGLITLVGLFYVFTIIIFLVSDPVWYTKLATRQFFLSCTSNACVSYRIVLLRIMCSTINTYKNRHKTNLKLNILYKTRPRSIFGNKYCTLGRGSTFVVSGTRQNADNVERFTNLGSVMAEDGGAESDVNCRIGKTASVFQRLRPIWTSCVFSTATKIWLYNSIVVLVASYASEMWKMTARIEHKLNVFHQRCLRKILKVTYKDHITNEEILLWANSRKLSDIVTERRFRMVGHILRLPDH